MKGYLYAVTTAVLLLSVIGSFASVPGQINFSGTLSDSSGNPLNETVTIQFSIYPDSVGGTSLWTETNPSVEVTDGNFDHYLGSIQSFPSTLFDGDAFWLQLIVDGEPLSPRQKLASVPYGFRSAEADHATTADTADIALASPPDNDWDISGDDICHETGNVGIGTTSPSVALDVNGKINSDSAYQFVGINVMSMPWPFGTLVGRDAGGNATSTGEATFIGYHAGYNNQGHYNTFVGQVAGYSNTTGFANTFLGRSAGSANTDGYWNTFVGQGTGHSNNTGSQNTFLGGFAGDDNTSGSNNTFLGFSTGYLNQNGSRNVFIGNRAGYTETGSDKLYIANGSTSDSVLIYGDFFSGRIGLGTTSPSAKLHLNGGGSEIGIKFNCGSSWPAEIKQTSGSLFQLWNGGAPRMTLDDDGNVGIGTTSPESYLHVAGTVTTQKIQADDVFGVQIASDDGATHLLVSDIGTVGIGTTTPSEKLVVNGTVKVTGDAMTEKELKIVRYWDASNSHTIKSYYDGSRSGLQVATYLDGSIALMPNGIGNVGIGTTSPSFKLDVLGDVNINSSYKIGGITVLSNDGNSNIMLGAYAGESNTGSYNSMVGMHSGRHNTGSYGTFVGYQSGEYNEADHNTFIGRRAGFDNTTGESNTFVGSGAGSNTISGSQNVCIGRDAGNQNETGTGNVFIGRRAGYYETGSNKLYIANDLYIENVLIYGDFSEGLLGMGTTSPEAKIHAETTGDTALYGHRSDGTRGFIAGDVHALYGFCTYPGGYGIWVHGDGYAGWFDGDVNINGNLTGGRGGTSIDHPLDPENKILNHNFVESNENLLIYRGKAQLNSNGESIVNMPEYFQALSKENEASIHITPVGRPFLTGAEWNAGYQSLTVYGDANREIFWEVLAERDDPVTRQNSRPIEEIKGPDNKLCNRGELLYPTAYGYPESMGRNHDKLVKR